MSVNPWIIAAGLLWVFWIAQAVLCAIQAGKFHRRLDADLRPGFAEFRPPVTVFVPFKGLELEAAANLHGLLQVDYPDYRLVFIVESNDDPAYTFLIDELAKIPNHRAHIVIAGQAPWHTGQKVHNLLAGLAYAESDEPDGERHPDTVWVFADADAIPNPDWLSRLVGPLSRPNKVAVTTGYRWFVPPRGPLTRFRFGAQWVSMINAGIATFAEHRRFRFAWGGSMAMRRSTALEGGLREMWRGALSDDYQVTQMCRTLHAERTGGRRLDQLGDTGAEIVYLPRCLVESPCDFTIQAATEFVRRQYRITKVHEPGVYWRSLLVVGVYVSGWATAWAAVIFGAISQAGWLLTAALFVLLGVGLANRRRAAHRRATIRELFGNGTFDRLAKVHCWERWGTSVVMLVNFMWLLSVAWGRRVSWRGRTYVMRGRQDIEQVV